MKVPSVRSSALGTIALVALLQAAPAAAQALPGEGKEDNPNSVFFVKNNSGIDLRCRVKQNGGEWQASFTLRKGGEFYRARRAASDTLAIFCDKPARFAAYRVTAGQRYAYLTHGDGTVALVHIATH
jgi:hypothetical protein